MKNRIKELRIAQGWSMAQLGSLLEPPANASQINKLEKGQRELTVAWMKRLAAALGCAPQDLICNAVPLVGYVGPGAEVFNLEGPESREKIEAVTSPPLNNTTLIALRIQGESMYPRYHNGDLIYYHPKHDFIEAECLQRECVVKMRNGMVFLKKLHKGRLPGRYVLRSHNIPDVEDVEIEWALPVRWHKPA
jgi:phage repressor protein C with HTH and peptisase S24 domain